MALRLNTCPTRIPPSPSPSNPARLRGAFPAVSRELSARQGRHAFPHVQALQLRLMASLEIRQMRLNGTAQLAIETIVFGDNGFVAYLRPTSPTNRVHVS